MPSSVEEKPKLLRSNEARLQAGLQTKVIREIRAETVRPVHPPQEVLSRSIVIHFQVTVRSIMVPLTTTLDQMPLRPTAAPRFRGPPPPHEPSCSASSSRPANVQIQSPTLIPFAGTVLALDSQPLRPSRIHDPTLTLWNTPACFSIRLRPCRYQTPPRLFSPT